MAVPFEMFSLIVRRNAIAARYPGRWRAFVRNAPNNTLRADPWLARLGFMGVLHIEEVTQELISIGLRFGEDMMGGDEMDGPVRPCPWLGWGTVTACGHERSVAWMIDDGVPRWPRRLGGRV